MTISLSSPGSLNFLPSLPSIDNLQRKLEDINLALSQFPGHYKFKPSLEKKKTSNI